MNSDLIRLIRSRLRATNGSFAFSHGLVFLGAAKDAENRWPKPQFEYVVLHQSSGDFAGASAHTVLELRSANAACCSILLPRYRRQDDWPDPRAYTAVGPDPLHNGHALPACGANDPLHPDVYGSPAGRSRRHPVPSVSSFEAADR